VNGAIFCKILFLKSVYLLIFTDITTRTYSTVLSCPRISCHRILRSIKRALVIGTLPRTLPKTSVDFTKGNRAFGKLRCMEHWASSKIRLTRLYNRCNPRKGPRERSHFESSRNGLLAPPPTARLSRDRISRQVDFSTT